MMFLDNDLVTIADATDFSHAREYSKNGIVKMIILGKYDVFERTYKQIGPNPFILNLL